jgi:hypothetical protein
MDRDAPHLVRRAQLHRRALACPPKQARVHLQVPENREEVEQARPKAGLGASAPGAGQS